MSTAVPPGEALLLGITCNPITTDNTNRWDMKAWRSTKCPEQASTPADGSENRGPPPKLTAVDLLERDLEDATNVIKQQLYVLLDIRKNKYIRLLFDVFLGGAKKYTLTLYCSFREELRITIEHQCDMVNLEANARGIE
ncbi:hypothetical protein L1887_25243 [Cichorium endivia]|nr:hypothetical protein L1887_25243 [Cichorium endivia]